MLPLRLLLWLMVWRLLAALIGVVIWRVGPWRRGRDGRDGRLGLGRVALGGFVHFLMPCRKNNWTQRGVDRRRRIGGWLVTWQDYGSQESEIPVEGCSAFELSTERSNILEIGVEISGRVLVGTRWLR
jgi:hypothetical protein